MERILIIGYGNPYRGDDGIGFHAAEQFASLNQDREVTVLARQELQPELAEVISRVDFVIFLDAATQGTPGTVRTDELAPRAQGTGLFSHELTPETLLAAAKILYGRCPEGVLVSVAGGDFGISSRMSAEVSAALPNVFARLSEIIASAKGRELVLAHGAGAGR
jgi:hydrogenase maturation protease